jgi:hypothetical protein
MNELEEGCFFIFEVLPLAIIFAIVFLLALPFVLVWFSGKKLYSFIRKAFTNGKEVRVPILHQ